VYGIWEEVGETDARQKVYSFKKLEMPDGRDEGRIVHYLSTVLKPVPKDAGSSQNSATV
jgi:hypothetical protein